jgi:hypothetical protein
MIKIDDWYCQMTLNSIDWEDFILYKLNDITKVQKIGEFVDELMNAYASNVQLVDNNTETE